MANHRERQAKEGNKLVGLLDNLGRFTILYEKE